MAVKTSKISMNDSSTMVYLHWITMLLVTPMYAADICSDAVCEYTFEIRRTRSMTYSKGRNTYNVALNGTDLQVVENSFRRKFDDDFIGSIVNPVDVITVDGYTRDIITINDKFPGPTIEVMTGSQVVVHVHNYLTLEGTTVHWHGMYMHNTPWMDGAAYVTQCPILPQEKFTYRFEADPVGTHWYHSHVHAQRLDGLFGLLIVHDRPPTLPSYALTVIDWLHFDAIALEVQNPYGILRQGTGELTLHDRLREYMPDNNEMTGLPFYSGLINGKGRFNDIPVPLTEFRVTAGQRYRFRMVNTGAEHAFEVSIDGHDLTVVAVDGFEVQPIDVDSIMMLGGETIDFEMTATRTTGKFWFRANMPRSGTGYQPTPDGILKGANAIVTYDVSAIEKGEPSSEPRNCTEVAPCVVFNCPFEKYPPGWWKTCIPMADAKSQMSQEYMDSYFGLQEEDDNVEEYFLNFGFPIGSSINARKLIWPRTALSHPNIEEYITPCDDDVCDEKGCLCTHIKELPANKTIQLVLLSYSPTIKFKAHHVAHIHGHSFAVLKMGFAEQNETTGFWVKENSDILCTGDNPRLCTKPQWNGRRPSLNKNKPPIQDNVIIPSRGYTVIRFRTNNPGFWFVHCHQELHLIEGMAMIFNEGPGLHKPLPEGFPTCGDFSWSNEDFQKYKDEINKKKTRTEFPATERSTTPEAGRSDCNVDTNVERNEQGISMDTGTAVGVAFGFTVLGGTLFCIPTVMFLCYLRGKNDKNV